jgi:cytoskeletal protein CcmA (bactofilin family)
MSEVKRSDLKFSGNMTFPGGIFKRVDVNGNVTFDGDLDCLDYRVYGGGTVNGNLKSANTAIHGSIMVTGDAGGEEIDIYGDGKIDGNLKISHLKTYGKLIVRGDITADKLNVSGQLDAGGKCDAEIFTCKGAFDIEETLNAEEVNIDLYGISRVKEIVGGKIAVRKAVGNRLGKLFAVITNPLEFYKEQLTTDTIEGDEIAIDHTKANVVRGNKVRIGDGCVIDLVEYRDTFDKTRDASVLKHVKI